MDHSAEVRPRRSDATAYQQVSGSPEAVEKLEALLRSDATFTGNAAGVLTELTEVVCAAFAVDRISIWQLSIDGSRLECIERFDMSTGRHAQGGSMQHGTHPHYFESIAAQRVLVFDGPAELAHERGVPLDAGTSATLDATVRVRGKAVAVLRHESAVARAWSAVDRWMASAAADFLGTVLQTRELLRLEAELRKHHVHLDELVHRRTSQVIRSNADLQRAVDELQVQAAEIRKSEDNLRKLFSAAPVPMLLIRRRDDQIVFANEKAADTLGRGMQALLEAESGSLFAHPSDRADLLATLDREGWVESLEVQLRGADAAGFWALLSARPVVYEGDVAAMIGFSDLTAQKTVEHQLRFLATRDSLTQAYNRHHFWQLAHTEMARVRRYKRPMSIAMLDADHFKQLNDAHGHDVGDRALKLIVEACQSTLRKNDVLARYGGEEFIVLFPETPGEGARLVMERLRVCIESLRIELEGGEAARFTVSVGVAGYLEETDFEALLKRADEALYQAKRAGRNCVVAG